MALRRKIPLPMVAFVSYASLFHCLLWASSQKKNESVDSSKSSLFWSQGTRLGILCAYPLVSSYDASESRITRSFCLLQ